MRDGKRQNYNEQLNSTERKQTRTKDRLIIVETTLERAVWEIKPLRQTRRTKEENESQQNKRRDDSRRRQRNEEKEELDEGEKSKRTIARETNGMNVKKHSNK
ncbi:hypothetical protein RUM43_008908 [Polyplax serrata]|uniref:Uncharacterized protein n=1 Tax=Polyplax serrata TaxID=468196 RepID=A0AAN8S0U1_POLSC